MTILGISIIALIKLICSAGLIVIGSVLLFSKDIHDDKSSN